jgi:hypothetical protein
MRQDAFFAARAARPGVAPGAAAKPERDPTVLFEQQGGFQTRNQPTLRERLLGSDVLIRRGRGRWL